MVKCFVCEKENSTKRCQGCHLTCYCSKECQKQDYRRGEHRTLCKRIQNGPMLCIVCRVHTERYCSTCEKIPICSPECEHAFPHARLCAHLCQQNPPPPEDMASDDESSEIQSLVPLLPPTQNIASDEESSEIQSLAPPPRDQQLCCTCCYQVCTVIFCILFALVFCMDDIDDMFFIGDIMKAMDRGNQEVYEDMRSNIDLLMDDYLRDAREKYTGASIEDKIEMVLGHMDAANKDFFWGSRGHLRQKKGYQLVVALSGVVFREECEFVNIYALEANKKSKLGGFSGKMKVEWWCSGVQMKIRFTLNKARKSTSMKDEI